MALGSRPSRDADENWARLQALTAANGIDVALLNETRVPSSTAAIYESRGTMGRDGKSRPWSTAVVSELPMSEIEDARPRNYLGHERTRLPFASSRPGSWTAAAVQVSDVVTVTCVALYGLLDDLSDASVHRSLSDLDPIFSDPRYKDRIVLGGDLNLTTQWEGAPLARANSVFDRIRALGLEDCLVARRHNVRLEGCDCPDPCTHTRTKWEPGSADGGYPHQMDYLFASRSLVQGGMLERCEALPPAEWNDVSDHAPIVASFSF
jgi:hypothetical protein